MSITCLPPPALYASAYEVERVLGSGSFGTCVLAVEVSTGRRYVLKQVALGGLSAAQREAAQREVDLLTTLLHPHVIRCYGAFTTLAQLNIVLEHADASDLSGVLSDAAALGERLSEGRIMTWWAQLASAVAFCHSHRILHRDLKSANVLLSRVATGEIVVKLADFGISRILTPDSSFAATSVGSPFSMSPEVVNGEAYTYSSDVWSLGCVLYECAQLKQAFGSTTLGGVVLAILRGVYAPVDADRYSPELCSLVQRLLSAEAGERPSMEDILALPCVRAALASPAVEAASAVHASQGSISTEHQAAEAGCAPPASSKGVALPRSGRAQRGLPGDLPRLNIAGAAPVARPPPPSLRPHSPLPPPLSRQDSEQLYPPGAQSQTSDEGVTAEPYDALTGYIQHHAALAAAGGAPPLAAARGLPLPLPVSPPRPMGAPASLSASGSTLSRSRSEGSLPAALAAALEAVGGASGAHEAELAAAESAWAGATMGLGATASGLTQTRGTLGPYGGLAAQFTHLRAANGHYDLTDSLRAHHITVDDSSGRTLKRAAAMHARARQGLALLEAAGGGEVGSTPMAARPRTAESASTPTTLSFSLAMLGRLPRLRAQPAYGSSSPVPPPALSSSTAATSDAAHHLFTPPASAGRHGFGSSGGDGGSAGGMARALMRSRSGMGSSSSSSIASSATPASGPQPAPPPLASTVQPDRPRRPAPPPATGACSSTHRGVSPAKEAPGGRWQRDGASSSGASSPSGGAEPADASDTSTALNSLRRHTHSSVRDALRQASGEGGDSPAAAPLQLAAVLPAGESGSHRMRRSSLQSPHLTAASSRPRSQSLEDSLVFVAMAEGVAARTGALAAVETVPATHAPAVLPHAAAGEPSPASVGGQASRS